MIIDRKGSLNKRGFIEESLELSARKREAARTIAESSKIGSDTMYDVYSGPGVLEDVKSLRDSLHKKGLIYITVGSEYKLTEKGREKIQD